MNAGFLGLKNPQDLLEKFRSQVHVLIHRPFDQYHVLDALVTGYHLHEWVWNYFLKDNDDLQVELFRAKFKSKGEFWNAIVSEHPNFLVIKEIVNRYKHYEKHKKATITREYESGWNHSRFGEGVWDAPSGISVVTHDIHINLNQLLEDLLRFWDDLIRRITALKKS